MSLAPEARRRRAPRARRTKSPRSRRPRKSASAAACTRVRAAATAIAIAIATKDPFRNPDAGRPQLKELKGRGVLVRKMARGFIVALDRDFKAAGTRWWRTTFGFAVPFDRIVAPGRRHEAPRATGSRARAPSPRSFRFRTSPTSTRAARRSLRERRARCRRAARRHRRRSSMSSGARKLEVGDDGKGGLKVGWGDRAAEAERGPPHRTRRDDLGRDLPPDERPASGFACPS